MNLDTIKKAIAEYFGQDPMRPFVLKWVAVYGAIVLASLAVFVFMQMKIGGIRAETAGYEAQVQLLSSMNVTSDNMQEVMGRIRTDSEADASRFLTTADIPSVIQTISKAASSNHVVLKKVNSIAPKDVEGFKVRSIPILLQVEGDYSNIGNFLAAVKDNTKWLYTVDEGRLLGDQKRLGRIVADIKLTFYARV